GALMLSGLATIGLAVVPWFAAAVVLWSLEGGLGTLFNINTGSLRQAIVPEHLLGRILSIASVLAWSASPLGALVGAFAIERTGDVSLVYVVIGALVSAVALFFYLFTSLGHAERYLRAELGPA
ncbi:MAG: hypothetical protein HYX56_04525, partial [Chloroflexi bacterium]|nr:hypothetical protein [Chloroflexota bacterium]